MVILCEKMEISSVTETESSDSISFNAPMCHTMMLPDQGDSSSEDECLGKKSPPSLRLEPATLTLDTHQHTPHSGDLDSPPVSSILHEGPGNKAWDDFVRKGSRLKNFIEDTLQLVTCKDGVEGRERPLLIDISLSPAKRARRMDLTTTSHAADLAREKTAECMILQQVSAMHIVREYILFLLIRFLITCLTLTSMSETPRRGS